MTAPEPTAPDGLYVLLKRGLYWRPNGQGYTGVLADAGRYSEADARARSEDGTTMKPASEADEFSPACWPETQIKVLQAALAASREAEAAAIRERDEAREEVDLVRDDSADQTRWLDSIAGKLGLAHDEGLDDAGPFLSAIERLSDALAATNARAERLADDRTAALDRAMKRGIRAWSNKLHIPVTRMMSRVLREEIHAALTAE